MPSKNSKTVDRLLEQAQSIQAQIDRLTSELQRLQIQLKKEEEKPLKKLKVGDVVVITTRERNGTRCVVNGFTSHRVSLITLDTNEKVIRKATNLTILDKK